ncbi:hypothetical protein QJR26_06935 [Clostridium baratii]
MQLFFLYIKDEMTKRSNALLTSAILGTVYILYLFSYFGEAMNRSTNISAQIGVTLAIDAVTPHIVLVVLAVIFNWVSYFARKTGFALTAGILYSVAGAVFLLYIFFVIPSIVLSFVGYSNLKKILDAEERKRRRQRRKQREQS